MASDYEVLALADAINGPRAATVSFPLTFFLQKKNAQLPSQFTVATWPLSVQ